MPIDKLSTGWTPTPTVTAPTTSPTPTPTQTQPPPVDNPAPPPPGPQTVNQTPPPQIQANRIVARVAQINRAKRPEIISSSSFDITKTSPSINGRTFKRFEVRFDDGSDSNFSAVRIWQKGYGTGGLLASGVAPESIPWNMVAQAKTSPVYVTLEASSENVIFGIEMLNSDGQGLLDLDQMPHILTNTT